MRAGALLLVVALSACGPSPRERPLEGAPRDARGLAAGSSTPSDPVRTQPSASPGAATDPKPPAAASSAAPAGLAPVEASQFVEIPVEGHAGAVVAVPVGATTPRPVVLATHGNYDTPDWQCSTWRAIVGPEPFVLCPRGVARPDSPSRDDVRFTYASNAALEVEIEAALAALRARFGAHVAEGPIVYTGFSLGAIMGVAIAARAKHPGRYASMVLVEGGHDRWTPATARAFASAGGKRVVFGCGQASCHLDAKRAAAHLERAGVKTRIVGVKDAGHDYGGRVAKEVQAAWPFVVEP